MARRGAFSRRYRPLAVDRGATRAQACSKPWLAKKNFLCVPPLCPWQNRRYLGATQTTSTPMADDPSQPKLGKHGGKRIKRQQGNAVTLRSRGNSRDYILARLEREGFLDLVSAIRTRRISAFAVAVELGWAKRPQALHGENCNQARPRVFDVRALVG
jgi:hypothetical protein